MQEVSVEADARPITVDVRFDPKVTNARRIASTAKRALEQDSGDNVLVKVVLEEEKGQ